MTSPSTRPRRSFPSTWWIARALFERKGFYGESGVDYPDNHIRFAVLARAALAVARFLFRTDVFHCHDWQAGLVPAYLRTTFASDPTFLGVKTLFTIHNLGYQGLFPKTALAEVGLDAGVYRPDGMEFFGRISYIKGGIEFADALNTVSPTYAREIQTPEYGFGLDGALLRARRCAHRHPQRRRLPRVESGDRSAHPRPLLRRTIWAGSGSASGNCSRNSACRRMPWKARSSAWSPASRGRRAPIFWPKWPARSSREGMYLVALGTGDPEYEDFFLRMAAEHPGRIAVRIGFDNALAHRIEAGADLFLMPSRYEPCGLNQMYSLRYGTVPVVRATGGLDDTIEEDTGFKFAEYSGAGALGRGPVRRPGVCGPGCLARHDAARDGARTFPGRRPPPAIRRSTGSCLPGRA